MKRLHFRQGDILLLQCDALPANAKSVFTKDRIILARGESTGHAHAISTEHAQEFLVEDDRFVAVYDFTYLVHEEHAPIIVSPGLYQIVRQREYTATRTSYVDD
jgi:hypothetical protein